jgi:hypothetical protein
MQTKKAGKFSAKMRAIKLDSLPPMRLTIVSMRTKNPHSECA